MAIRGTRQANQKPENQRLKDGIPVREDPNTPITPATPITPIPATTPITPSTPIVRDIDPDDTQMSNITMEELLE